MSLTVDGVWKAGVWASTVWTQGVWYEPGQTPPVIPPPTIVSGVKRKPYRVRRSDFSTEENYRLALKAAFAGATHSFAEEVKTQQTKKAKTIKVVQAKTQIDDPGLIMAFIKAIESEYE